MPKSYRSLGYHLRAFSTLLLAPHEGVPMSEDFDREAEKERLREKLEREEQEREATEHMSDLLLKGATMTNAHCDACGDPIFRYDGQEFCPTCGERVEDDGAPDDATDETPADVGETGTETEPPGDGATDSGPSPARHEGSVAEGTGAASQTPPVGAPSEQKTRTDADASAAQRSPAAADLGKARASLVRTLSDLAARAEAAEDVRRTRDFLAAAREAAEALAALDRTDR